MSITNLFTLKNQENDIPEDNFFEKLEEVTIEHETLLPKEVINSVNHLVDSYKRFIQSKEKLEELSSSLAREAKELDLIALASPSVNASVSNLKERLFSKLQNLFRENFPIALPAGFIEALKKEDFEIEKEVIMNLFMEFTNNGDTDQLLRTETLKNLADNILYSVEEPKLNKAKIQITRFYYTEQCSIWKERVISYSSRNWSKPTHWENALDAFAEENGIIHSTGSALFSYYRDHNKASKGAFEKQTYAGSQVLKSTKLFKNGKMELEFVTKELAAAFYRDWIIPAREL